MPVEFVSVSWKSRFLKSNGVKESTTVIVPGVGLSRKVDSPKSGPGRWPVSFWMMNVRPSPIGPVAGGRIWKVNVVEKSWMFTRPLAKRLPACWPPAVVRSAAEPLNVVTPVAVRSLLLAKPPEWSMRVVPPLE